MFQCVPQTANGERCPSNEISFNNTCHTLYEELGPDKRLEADLFGQNIGYRCKREDYVTWSDGTCYPLLSPAAVCSPGQQIRWSVYSYSRNINKISSSSKKTGFVQQIMNKQFNFQVFRNPNRGGMFQQRLSFRQVTVTRSQTENI